jgi:hypothetical protein
MQCSALVIIKHLVQMVCMLYFIKKNWSVVRDEVTREVLQALNSGMIPKGWNETAIVFDPKGAKSAIDHSVPSY